MALAGGDSKLLSASLESLPTGDRGLGPNSCSVASAT